jgi:hypothetical protein
MQSDLLNAFWNFDATLFPNSNLSLITAQLLLYKAMFSPLPPSFFCLLFQQRALLMAIPCFSYSPFFALIFKSIFFSLLRIKWLTRGIFLFAAIYVITFRVKTPLI